MRSRKLRVSNVKFESGLPYRALQELDFVEYSEESLIPNSRRLHEGEVDVALISVVEFASHGGYVGLDFGIAAEFGTETVFLCSNEEVEKLESVYLYEGSSSTAMLLSLLLRERWNIAPRLERVPGLDLYPMVKGKAGALVMDYSFSAPPCPIRYREDLVAAWRRHTGLPFVFMVWAARPTVLGMKHLKSFREAFHHVVRARETIAAQYAGEFGVPEAALRRFVGSSLSYYLDSHLLQGMNGFFERAARHRLLPQAQYRSATYSLLNKRATKSIPEESLDSVLTEVSQGKRIGVRNGIRLARHSSLADLGLAAEMRMDRLYHERSVSLAIQVDVPPDGKPMAVLEEIERHISAEVSCIQLALSDTELAPISEYELLLHEIATETRLPIEGFPVEVVIALASQSKLSVDTVVSRLVTAGLSRMSARGGGMLIDRVMEMRRGVHISVRQWLDTIRAAHRFGAKSSSYLAISSDETWEERLLHLTKLRSLQDETRGFSFLSVQSSAGSTGPVSLDERLRATLLARLYMDNVPSIAETSFVSDSSRGALALCFGANEVIVPVNRGEKGATQELLTRLVDIGMEFSTAVPRVVSDPSVH